MKTFIYLLSFYLIISSFSYQQKKTDISSDSSTKEINISNKGDDTTSNIERIKELNLIKTINPTWVNYYKSKIKDFNIGKFELIKKWKEKNLLQGNIIADFDKGFNKNHTPFLINSPDSFQYIDLDYYQTNIIKNKKGQLSSSGGEVDQEVNLINRKTKEVKRIDFYGSTSGIEDAKWISNTVVALYGFDVKQLAITVVDFEKLAFKLYLYPDTIGKVDYSRKIRLKKVKFE